MLTFLGFAMVITFMYLIMTKRLSALIALILVPILFALFGGFAPKIGPMMLEGITKLAPTGVMLMFAILYFALMIDSGLFDPAVRKILKLVKGDPLKVSVGTAVLALVVSLDGDGAHADHSGRDRVCAGCETGDVVLAGTACHRAELGSLDHDRCSDDGRPLGVLYDSCNGSGRGCLCGTAGNQAESDQRQETCG